jgi:hypothetical protein
MLRFISPTGSFIGKRVIENMIGLNIDGDWLKY